MTIEPIKTKEDYQQALARLVIFDAKKGSAEADELEILGLLVDNYEKENFPIGFPYPVDAIKFRMEQLGYNGSEIANVIGLKTRASEISNRKGQLPLKMIRLLQKRFNIPT